MGEIIDWPSDYQLMVTWEIIDKMELGTKIKVSDFAKKRPDIFIQASKMFIDCYHTAEFNFNYTTLKKILPCKSL